MSVAVVDTAPSMWSRCDSCGRGTGWDVGPLLLARGWRGFEIDGVRDGVSWAGTVWGCPGCAPAVEAGTAPIRTFLGGFTTTPSLAEPAAALGEVDERV